ncbi:hypothetical protein LIER_06462 [Lithospermum erythrorhizon]|uniref:Uncharacterized protein n=1 Tax=Lithospermum erythrorhizon TaxID=34254 RepID=A0AAV3P5Q3_LITER
MPPPQPREVGVEIDRYGSELSESYLASLKTRFSIPPGLIIRRPLAIEQANTLPLGIRTIFVVALENGIRLLFHTFVGGVLSVVMVLELENHGEVGSTVPLATNPSPPPAPLIQTAQVHISPSPPSLAELSVSRKRKRSLPTSILCPSLPLRLPPSGTSPNDMGHEELISSLSSLGSEEAALRPYKGLFSSYEEVSVSFYRIPQLERKLNDLKRHKERYASNVLKTDSLLAELEGVRVERNSAQQERGRPLGRRMTRSAPIEMRRSRHLTFAEEAGG